MRTDRSVARSSFRPALAAAAVALALALPRAALALEVVEVVEGAAGEPARVVVYRPAPEPLPARERLAGADIRTHGFAAAPAPSGIRTLAWEPGAPSRIPSHDWRAPYRGALPVSGAGSALATQSWNPRGERYAPSRIRSHDWVAEHAGRPE